MKEALSRWARARVTRKGRVAKNQQDAQEAAKLLDSPLLQSAVKKAIEQGMDVKVLDYDGAERQWPGRANSVQAQFVPETDCILLNGTHESWNTSEVDKSGWFSTTDPERIIDHELAHREHMQHIGITRLNSMIGRKPKHADLIAIEVGRYAATSEAEFVAETRVGLKSGEKYSPDIMAYYRSLGGVE